MLMAQSSNWKWPDIPGVHDFKGHLAHSAKWDDSYSFQDKRVAVIGSGSSAIQIVPKLQPGALAVSRSRQRWALLILTTVAKRLTSFNRSATWIVPEFAAEFAPEGRGSKFPEEQKKAWRDDPASFLKYRKAVDSTMNHFFDLQYKTSQLQLDAVNTTSKLMETRLQKKPELAKLLVPGFALGCRR